MIIGHGYSTGWISCFTIGGRKTLGDHRSVSQGGASHFCFVFLVFFMLIFLLFSSVLSVLRKMRTNINTAHNEISTVFSVYVKRIAIFLFV